MHKHDAQPRRREVSVFESNRSQAVRIPKEFEFAARVHYGEIRAELERAGTPPGGNDILIAAHALPLDMTIVTNNRREFDRVIGLRVENRLA